MNRSLPNVIYKAVISAAVLVMTIVNSVNAQNFIFPASNPTFTGGANSWPLSAGTGGGSNMCQWLYLNSEFTNSPGSMLITTIYLKPATSGSFTYSNLSVKLGNTSLTTMTTGSWYTGLTTVYNPSTVTMSVTSGSWYAITLPTPFFYSGGGLLLEITHGNTWGIGSGVTLNQFTVTGRTGRMYGTPAAGGTADAATACFAFDGVPAVCSGTPLAGTITTAAMTAAAPICAGGTYSLAASNPNTAVNGLTYQWQSSPTSTGTFANVTNGTGATTLNYTTGPNAATTWYRVGITCTNSGITTYSAPYQVLVGAMQPGNIVGRPSSCPGDTAYYTVPGVSGHTYNWTLPTGWSGTSTSNTILVTMGASAGTISVTATGCGGTSVARTLTIVPGSAPSTPGAISGSNTICPGTLQTYSVTPVVGANFYTWTLPNGWTGTSTSNVITVMTDTTSGNIVVKAGNGCGFSPTNSLNVKVLNSLANPGPITTSAINNVYCSGALYTFSISPVVGATSYQWILPSGWSGTNTGTSIQAFAGTGSGQLQVAAYVSCATSPISSLSVPVTTTVTPAVSIATGAPAICQGLPTTFTATPTNGGTSPSYQWKKNNINVTGSGATYTDQTMVTGDVISVALASSVTCRTFDTVRSNNITASVIPTVTPGISINSVPVIKTCAGTMLNFTTTSLGGGSAPIYQWYVNGSAIGGANGTTYSSASFANGDTVTVKMTTSAICYTSQIGTSNKVGLEVKPSVAPSVSVVPSSTQPGQSITFTVIQNGGGPTPTYQWVLNGVDIPNATGDTYTTSTLMSGDYISVRMQSYDPCAQPTIAISNPVLIGSPASVAGLNGWDGSVSMYPNPNRGKFTVSSNWSATHIGKRVSIDVYNLLGQMIYHSEVAPDRAKWSYDIQLSDAIANGHYMLRLTTQDGMKANLPVVISR
jgi:hypothetical protein